MAKRIDYFNTKFGLLSVVEPVEKCNGTQIFYKCRCDCGNICNIRATALRSKSTISCGCYRKKVTSERLWKGCGELSSAYLSSIACRARAKNREFSIDVEYCWNLFLKQDRKCALSGELLTFYRSKRCVDKSQTASLDRIDSSKGYIEGNVQWVHKFINKMKQSFSNIDFINKCAEIANYSKDKI